MKHLSPLKAIRQHCLACAKRPKYVRLCDTPDCYLFPFRMGHNPARKGISSKKAFVKSIPDSLLPNSRLVFERFPEGIRARKDIAMSKEIVQPGASGGEIRLIKMEAVGKVQMLDKKISIEW